MDERFTKLQKLIYHLSQLLFKLKYHHGELTALVYYAGNQCTKGFNATAHITSISNLLKYKTKITW